MVLTNHMAARPGGTMAAQSSVTLDVSVGGIDRAVRELNRRARPAGGRGRVEVLVIGDTSHMKHDVYRMEAQAEILNAEPGSREAIKAFESMCELTTRIAIEATKRARDTYRRFDPRRWRCAWHVRRYEAELTGTRWAGLI